MILENKIFEAQSSVNKTLGIIGCIKKFCDYIVEIDPDFSIIKEIDNGIVLRHKSWDNSYLVIFGRMDSTIPPIYIARVNKSSFDEDTFNYTDSSVLHTGQISSAITTSSVNSVTTYSCSFNINIIMSGKTLLFTQVNYTPFVFAIYEIDDESNDYVTMSSYPSTNSISYNSSLVQKMIVDPFSTFTFSNNQDILYTNVLIGSSSFITDKIKDVYFYRASNVSRGTKLIIEGEQYVVIDSNMLVKCH